MNPILINLSYNLNLNRFNVYASYQTNLVNILFCIKFLLDYVFAFLITLNTLKHT